MSRRLANALRRKRTELAVVLLDLAIASLAYLTDSYLIATVMFIAAMLLLVAIINSNF